MASIVPNGRNALNAFQAEITVDAVSANIFSSPPRIWSAWIYGESISVVCHFLGICGIALDNGQREDLRRGSYLFSQVCLYPPKRKRASPQVADIPQQKGENGYLLFNIQIYAKIFTAP